MDSDEEEDLIAFLAPYLAIQSGECHRGRGPTLNCYIEFNKYIHRVLAEIYYPALGLASIRCSSHLSSDRSLARL